MKPRTPRFSHLFLLLIALLCLALSLTACSGDEKKPPVTTDPVTETPAPDPIITINGDPIVFAAEGGTDLSMLSVEKSIVIEAQTFDGEQVFVNGTEAKPSLTLEIPAITRDKVLNIEIKKGERTVTHTVNLMPSTFPDFKTEGASATEGDYYLSTYDHEVNYLFKLSGKGDLLFYKTITRIDENGNEVSTNGLDFCKHVTSEGKIRYTYMPYLANAFADGDCAGINPGSVVVMDENYKVIDEIFYLDENGEKILIDPHGFAWIDEGHYIVTAYKQMLLDVPEKLGATDNKADLAVLLVQEVKDGQVLWSFSSADYDQFLYETNAVRWKESTARCYDYVHFNSMAVDKDGNLLISCRHLDAILKISREDGSLIWQLGGTYSDFPITANRRFSYQHSIVVAENGDYLLFDNANNYVTGGLADCSSVLRMTVDEEAKTITAFERHKVLDFYSIYMGAIREIDAEKEIYLWSVGGNYETDGKNPPEWSMIEYTPGERNVAEHIFTFRFEEGRRRLYSANKCA